MGPPFRCQVIGAMKKTLIILLVPVLLCLSARSAAMAANETITLSTSVTPLKGQLYREKRVAASMSLSVEVHTPDSSPLVNPLKRSVMKFPKDLTYNPNNRLTPVCSDDVLNEQSNLAAGVAAIVDLCPRSVIGTGTAEIYLAKLHKPSALIADPQLVIFNAGRDSRGNAKMKIYAFSQKTNYGILMYGSLTKKGIQDVSIPVLSNDSATAKFTLSIPGPPLHVTVGGRTRTIQGLDPNYARARCSTGTWTTGGTFTLGERSFPSGANVGPDTTVEATPFTTSCFGKVGHARLTGARVHGPRQLRQGSMRIFKVRVRNTGTATARRVKVTASGSGRGQASTGNIAPGGTRWIPVKVLVAGRKGTRAQIVFRIRANGTTARVVSRGRILR